MAYTTASNVTILTGQTYSVDSKPLSSTEVVSIIAQADAEIDSVLAMESQTVPTPTPTRVELASRLLSAAYVEERVYTGRSRNESNRAQAWRRRALGPKYDKDGTLGGVLGGWLASQAGGASGPRFQSDWNETEGDQSPQFRRKDFI